MLNEFLKKNITSQAGYINANGYGYGQVEPNHLANQASKEVYAQLPADKSIDILENGQFAKYDYAEGVVNFTGPGEWMLVFNEIKLYRDHQVDAEFAMLKDNYQARIYSPFGGSKDGTSPDTVWNKQSRYYNGTGVDAADGSITFTAASATAGASVSVGGKSFPIDDVTAGPDMYEPHYNEDPFHIESLYKEQRMPEGTTMVPRLIKTEIGDIITTNMIADDSVSLKAILSPRAADGILSTSGDGSIQWQVVKIYTMPDHQPGVKIMRIK